MNRRIAPYLRHQFALRHRRGFGIHSPYVFRFVSEALHGERQWPVPDEIRSLHRDLGKDPEILNGDTLGAPGLAGSSHRSTVGSFVKRSSVSPRYGALLYRIARWQDPDVVLELGTGVGVSSIYLAAGAPEVPMVTIEGNPFRAEKAREVIKRAGRSRVEVVTGGLDTELTRVLDTCRGTLASPARGGLLAFLDGNHRMEPTLAYAESLIRSAKGKGVLVLDDIYWSGAMEQAWKEITGWPDVRVSIDVYRCGIILLRSDLNKDAFRIRF